MCILAPWMIASLSTCSLPHVNETVGAQYSESLPGHDENSGVTLAMSDKHEDVKVILADKCSFIMR